MAFNYFKKEKKVSFARECLVKLGNNQALLDLYIEEEMFEDALNLYQKISSKEVVDPAKVLLPYAGMLLRESRFEEALEKYKQIGKMDLCIQTLQRFININITIQNYLLVAKFMQENSKLTSTETDEFPQDALFYLFVHFFKQIS